MKRRIVTFILAFALLLSLAVPAFAATLPDGSEPRFTAEVDKNVAVAGDTVTVTVYANVTDPVEAISVNIIFNNQLVEWVSSTPLYEKETQGKFNYYTFAQKYQNPRYKYYMGWVATDHAKETFSGVLFSAEFKVKSDFTGIVKDAFEIRGRTQESTQVGQAEGVEFRDAVLPMTFKAAADLDDSSYQPSTDCISLVYDYVLNLKTNVQTTVGELLTLDTGTVFNESDGHMVTYSLANPDDSRYVKFKDNIPYFTASQPGEYKIDITATCSNGCSITQTYTITVEAPEHGLDSQYGYDETPADSVNVIFTLSNNGDPVFGYDGTLLSHLDITVPYFDLALYGMQEFYRYHTENGEGEYIDRDVVQRPTGLHLYLYMLERYYIGLPEELCCIGYTDEPGKAPLVMRFNDSRTVTSLYGHSYESTFKAFQTSGGATSLYMTHFWGHDENLMYYRNHVYPYMSPGWGATSDYILLSDGDTWDVAMFDDWSFYNNGGAFCKFDKDEYTVEAGEYFEFQTLSYATMYTATNFTPQVNLDVDIYDENWEPATFDYAESTGIAKWQYSAPQVPGTYYLLGVDRCIGQSKARFAPATAKLIVTAKEEPEPEIMYGDVNGDGTVDVTDAQLVCKYVLGSASFDELQQSAADVSGDSTVDITDAQMIVQLVLGKIAHFTAQE